MPALREAMKLKERLVFLDFLTDQKANVFPMVGNGKGLNQMDLPPHMRDLQLGVPPYDRDYGNLS